MKLTTRPAPPSEEAAPAKVPEAIAHVLGLLRALMDGATLTAPDVARRSPFQEPAIRRHLTLLAATFREVVAVPETRPRAYRFVWPREQASDGGTAMALAIARSAMVALRGSALDQKLASLLEDHLRRTPQAPGHDLSRAWYVRSRLLRAPGVDPDAVDVLAVAILEQRQVTVEYQHFSGKASRDRLEPLTLIPAEEGLYCYARCVDSNRDEHLDTLRLYNVVRLKRVRKTTEPFTYPPSDVYDPARVFRHCFGIFLPDEEDARPARVVLRFAPQWQAWFTYHRIHDTQIGPTTDPDGWLRVELELYVTLDLVRWLRGLGREVEIAAPSDLRQWAESGEGAGFLRRRAG